MRVTIRIIQKKIKGSDTYPIYLYLYYKGYKNLISTGFSCLPRDWNKDKGEFKKSERHYAKKNRVLRDMLVRAEDIILDMRLRDEVYSFEKFKAEYTGGGGSWAVSFILSYADEFNDKKQYSNRDMYKSLANSIERFTGNKKVRLEAINKNWLERYVKYLERNGNKSGGIAVKLKSLRAAYNKAIERGIVSKKLYPFDDFKISRYKSSKKNKYLTSEEIKRLKEVVLGDRLNFYRNLFLLQYHLWGVNLTDLIVFRWKDVKVDRIEYTRAKTDKQITILLSVSARRLLDYFKMIPSNTGYVLPLLPSDSLSEQQIFNRKNKEAQKYNKALKEIAVIANINNDITAYWARHSFATAMKRNGVAVSAIADMLGHSDIRTTQNTYLGKHDEEFIKVIANKI